MYYTSTHIQCTCTSRIAKPTHTLTHYWQGFQPLYLCVHPLSGTQCIPWATHYHIKGIGRQAIDTPHERQLKTGTMKPVTLKPITPHFIKVKGLCVV